MLFSEKVRDTLFSQSIGILLFILMPTLIFFAYESVLLLALWILLWISFTAWIACFSLKREKLDMWADFYRFKSTFETALAFSGIIPLFGVFWSEDRLPPYLKKERVRYEQTRTHWKSTHGHEAPSLFD